MKAINFFDISGAIPYEIIYLEYSNEFYSNCL